MSDEDKHDTNYINKKWHEHLHAQVAQPVSTAHRARCFVVTPWCHMHLMAQDVLESSVHPIFMHERLSLTSPSSLSTSTCPSPSSFHFSVLMHPEPHTDFNYLNSMQHNLRNSAKGSNDAYDVTVSLTGYEPNDMVFNELGQLPGFLLLHCPVIGPGHRRRYARQAAHRRTPRTSRLLRSRRHVSQSVVVVCCVR